MRGVINRLLDKLIAWMVGPKPKPCSRCGEPRDRGNQRLCKSCHADNMRAWRAERRYVRKAA